MSAMPRLQTPASRSQPSPTGEERSRRAHELLVAALAYAVAGWPVLPVHTPDAAGGCSCGQPACASAGQAPAHPPRAARRQHRPGADHRLVDALARRQRRRAHRRAGRPRRRRPPRRPRPARARVPARAAARDAARPDRPRRAPVLPRRRPRGAVFGRAARPRVWTSAAAAATWSPRPAATPAATATRGPARTTLAPLPAWLAELLTGPGAGRADAHAAAARRRRRAAASARAATCRPRWTTSSRASRAPRSGRATRRSTGPRSGSASSPAPVSAAARRSPTRSCTPHSAPGLSEARGARDDRVRPARRPRPPSPDPRLQLRERRARGPGRRADPPEGGTPAHERSELARALVVGGRAEGWGSARRPRRTPTKGRKTRHGHHTHQPTWPRRREGRGGRDPRAGERPRARRGARRGAGGIDRAAGHARPARRPPHHDGDERFELVAGFHRLAAARALGLADVPVVVRDGGDRGRRPRGREHRAQAARPATRRRKAVQAMLGARPDRGRRRAGARLEPHSASPRA